MASTGITPATTEAESNQPRLGDPETRPDVASSNGIAAAEITQGPKLSEYVGRTMLFQPLQHEEWKTTQGDADVLVAYALTFTYTLDSMNAPIVEWEDLGEVPVFWSFVQKQLDEQASADTPWVLGTLSKGTRAYRIDPPTPEDLNAAAKVLEEWRIQTEGDF